MDFHPPKYDPYLSAVTKLGLKVEDYDINHSAELQEPKQQVWKIENL